MMPAGCWTGLPAPTAPSSAAATPMWPPPAAGSPRPLTSSQPYGCSRSMATCAGSTLSPPGTPAVVAARPRRGSWSTLCHAPQKQHKPQKPSPELFLWILWFLWRVAGVPDDGHSARRDRVWRAQSRSSDSLPAVTLSNENGPSRSWPCRHPYAAGFGAHKPTMANRRGAASLWSGACAGSYLAEHGTLAGGIPRRGRRRGRRQVRTMASAGIRRNRNGTRYQVWWRLDDGTQGSKTFDSRGLARD